MDLELFAWLLTDDGQRLLDEAGATDPRRLREQYAADRVSAALTQVELREKARAKFGDLATRMYFTREALEQATRLAVAEHRAARLGAAAPSSVVDLGCGLGADLIAFSRAGLIAAGVDLDPLRVAIARANLAALGVGGAVSQADATAIDLDPFGSCFADPARRSGRGRSWRPEDWTPAWSFVEEVLQRDAVVKLAPALPHALIPEEVEAEWVSDRGEVAEVALWSGRLASTKRRATVLAAGGLATVTEEDDPGAEVVELGAFLYEPDGAVIRAGLVGAVAAGVGGGLLDPHIAYVTSAESFRTPFARSYRVMETLPFREKQLRAALRERDIGALTIKKRGVSVTPEELRKRLALRGSGAATLVLTRIRGNGAALLVEPF